MKREAFVPLLDFAPMPQRDLRVFLAVLDRASICPMKVWST